MDRPTNTSDGSAGASPAVVTAWQDDDDLTADTDQTSEILGTSSVRTATRPASATAAMEAPAKEDSPKEASANGSSAAGENGARNDHALGEVPALPADGIGSTRNPFAFSRSVSAPVPPVTDGWTSGEASRSAADAAPTSADNEPIEATPAAADAGTRRLADGIAFGTGASTEQYKPSRADSPAAQASASPEPSTVSAAAFVWDPPEPSSSSSSSRDFLRASASATASPPPRTPPVIVNPPRGRPGQGGASAPGARPKRSAKRSARQAHLTIARVEPWSVMKFSFVVSLIAFVILFVAVSVIYGTLSALGVFTSLQHVVQNVTSSQDSSGVNAAKWFSESRVLSYTALLGALNIVLITAMCTIGAVVYNLTSRLIGGVEVTLRETE